MTQPRLTSRLLLIALAVLSAGLVLAALGYGLAHAAPAAAGVTIVPPAAAKSGTPSSVVTYSLHVTNTGTAPDTFTVTVSGYSWPTSYTLDGIGTILLPLLPGMGGTVAVTVTVPVTATGYDTALVTATSVTDPGVSDSSILTTSVDLRLYLPIILKDYP